jgi:peptidoglycan hydrolase-like protein with peptidoglycan-binding domain
MGAGLLPVVVLGAIAAAAAALGGKKKAAAGPPTSGTFTLDQNLPPQLEQQVLGAIATATDPNQLLFLASQMDVGGYHLTAAALRQRAAELGAAPGAPPAAPPESPPMGPPQVVPTSMPPIGPPIAPAPGPAPAMPGISGLDANMDPQTRAAVMQALATETDPAKLSGFAAAIQFQYPIAAGLLMTKAAAMQATQPLGPTIPATPPSPPPPGYPVPIPSAGPPTAFDPSQLAPAHSIRALMNAGQWYAALTLLNDWMRENHADPGISFIDLSFWRDIVDDLQDPGNFGLAVDGLQALANQKGYSLPPNLPGSVAGVLDGQTFATLLNWAATHGHPIPQAIVPIASAIQSALAGLNLNVIAQPGAPAPAAAWPPPLAAPAGMPTLPPLQAVIGPAAPLAPIVTLRDVQHALNLLHGAGTPLVEDNLNGPKTIAAVKAFQQSRGLTVDGIAGPMTKAALQAALAGAAVPPPFTPAPTVPGLQPIVAPGAIVGPVVTLKDVQHALNVLGGPGTPLVEDNLNGPKTIAAVKAFQQSHGLTVDGIAGPMTKAALQAAVVGGALAPLGGLLGAPPFFAAAPRRAAPVGAPAAAALPAAVPALASLKDVQHALNVLAGPGTPLVEDGRIGPKTIAAVKAFQAAHGLTVDGVAGPQMKSALQAAIASAAPHPATQASLGLTPIAAAVPPPPLGLVKVTSPAAPPRATPAPPITTLRDVQHALNLLHGSGTPLVEDGINGPKTIAAVKAFQAAHGLTVDGVAGPMTKGALQTATAGVPSVVVSGLAPKPQVSITGTWKLATNADVTKDGVANRYQQLLAQPVGTETPPEMHNGRCWKFRVISNRTDPALTPHPKDVNGYVLQPLAATGS